MKRIFDCIVSLCGLITLAPFLLPVALLILIDSPGPIFYRQDRIGKNQKIFRLYKFRSMVANADQTGGYSTSRGDQRITRIGHILRRTSIDELPQLLNVLVGDMSLVGPRPDVPAQKSLYHKDDWEKRHRVRPGITGLAQATLRSSATMKQRTKLDLSYVDNQSLWLDIRIIALTARQILIKGGNH